MEDNLIPSKYDILLLLYLSIELSSKPSMKELSFAPHGLFPTLFLQTFYGLQWFAILCPQFHAVFSHKLFQVCHPTPYGQLDQVELSPSALSARASVHLIEQDFGERPRNLTSVILGDEFKRPNSIFEKYSLRAQLEAWTTFFTLTLHLVMWTQVAHFCPQCQSIVKGMYCVWFRGTLIMECKNPSNISGKQKVLSTVTHHLLM